MPEIKGVKSGSGAFRLDRVDVAKIKRDVLLALTGLVLAIAATLMDGVNAETAIGATIAAIAPAGLNMLRRWMTNYQANDSGPGDGPPVAPTPSASGPLSFSEAPRQASR